VPLADNDRRQALVRILSGSGDLVMPGLLVSAPFKTMNLLSEGDKRALKTKLGRVSTVAARPP
jgi:hypothetical protein